MALIAPAAAIAATMLGGWLLSIVRADASVVDPIWGPAFALLALAVALARPAPGAGVWLVLALTSCWGLRLGLHLTRRKLAEPGEDRRYGAIRARDPASFWWRSLIVVFAVQGFAIAVVGLPIELLPDGHRSLGALAPVGLGVGVLGLGFEAVADEQLRRFKRAPDNAGAVMDRGLWRYSRHPNYFGDACVWWGIWLLALSAGSPIWSVVGPLAMTWLLARGSGKPTLERDIAERRPGYARYVETTSGFVPLPPRGVNR